MMIILPPVTKYSSLNCHGSSDSLDEDGKIVSHIYLNIYTHEHRSIQPHHIVKEPCLLNIKSLMSILKCQISKDCYSKLLQEMYLYAFTDYLS